MHVILTSGQVAVICWDSCGVEKLKEWEAHEGKAMVSDG